MLPIVVIKIKTKKIIFIFMTILERPRFSKFSKSPFLVTKTLQIAEREGLPPSVRIINTDPG
jgi:hypothetical protein